MSIVWLKNALFNHGDRSDSKEYARTSLVESSDCDLESKAGAPSRATPKGGFRIDARIVSDATIGLSDGLTVPFALTAGLSALGDTHVVIYGGLAELIAGAISMGLGAYLGAKTEL
jgi:hypothetical protein